MKWLKECNREGMGCYFVFLACKFLLLLLLLLLGYLFFPALHVFKVMLGRSFLYFSFGKVLSDVLVCVCMCLCLFLPLLPLPPLFHHQLISSCWGVRLRIFHSIGAEWHKIQTHSKCDLFVDVSGCVSVIPYFCVHCRYVLLLTYQHRS